MRRRRCGLAGPLNGGEPVAAPGVGANGLVEPAGAQRRPGQADGALQRPVSNDDTGPDRFQQLLLVHHPETVVDEINEQVESARLELDFPAVQAELAKLLVELEVGETVIGHDQEIVSE